MQMRSVDKNICYITGEYQAQVYFKKKSKPKMSLGQL